MARDWRQRLNRLPVVLPQLKPYKREQKFHEQIGRVDMIATYNHMPGIGSFYVITMFGPDADCDRIARELENQLGEWLGQTRVGLEEWSYFWSANFRYIPQTKVHRVVGMERIGQICHLWGLSVADELILHDWLAAQVAYEHDISKRLSTILGYQEVMDSGRWQNLKFALAHVSHEFFQKQMAKLPADDPPQ